MAPRESHWRRWWFLITLITNVLFMLYAAAGVRVVYAPTHAGHATLWGSLIGIFFWAGLVAATMASGMLGVGALRGHYQLLLVTALGGACYCGGYLGLATTVLTLRMGAGFLEPLTLWQLLAAQILIIWSARTHAPLSRLAAPRAFGRAARRLASAETLTRLRRGVRAFADALATTPDSQTAGNDE